MTARSIDPGVALAGTIRSLPDAWRLFRRFGSPRAMAFGLALASVVRLATIPRTGLSRWDLVAVAIVLVLIPFVEWFIHLVVLHAKPRTVRGALVDPGVGHREHHLNPASVNWVLLRAVDAALFQAVNAVVVTAVVGIPLFLVGAPILGPVLTGVIVAVIGLAHYEWSHFLFHTAYRPKSRYYRRLKNNHRLHHWRNERYWLGITSNAADRALRTYPSRSDVPISATARNLDPDPDVPAD